MKKMAMILIAFATIGGCATFSNNSSWVWVGESSAELLADWGTPSDQVDMTDGGSVWTYYENVVGNRIDANNIPKLGATKIEFVVNVELPRFGRQVRAFGRGNAPVLLFIPNRAFIVQG